MRKMKNYLKTGILLLGILTSTTNCEKEDSIPISDIEQQIINKPENNDNIIFLNPDNLNIQLKLNDNIKTYNSKNVISFENKFGKPLYNSSIALDSKFKTLITPLYDEKTLLLKGWISGFFTGNGEIKFMHSVADENQIKILDLKKGKLILTDKKVSKTKKQHKNYSARLLCGSSYRYICGTVYSGSGQGEMICGYYYEGTTCVDVTNNLEVAYDQYTNNDDSGETWEDPFSGGEISEPINCGLGYYLDENNVCQPDRIINNLTPKADCVYGKLIHNAITNHNLITETFIQFGGSSIFGENLIYQTELNLTNSDGQILGGKFHREGDNYYVTLNESQLNNRSSLEIATTILHESIHALLRSQYVNTNESFIAIFGEYMKSKTGSNVLTHDIMRDNYIPAIANALKQFDNNEESNSFYETLAWEGLNNFLTEEERTRIIKAHQIARDKGLNCN